MVSYGSQKTTHSVKQDICTILRVSFYMLVNTFQGAAMLAMPGMGGANDTFKFHLHLSVMFTYCVSCNLENLNDTVLTVLSNNCSYFISSGISS